MSNVNQADIQDRLIPVEWEGYAKSDKSYIVDLEITGFDRSGLLNEVLQAINETKTNITEVNGKTDKNKMVTILITISIHNVAHLHKVVDRIKQIKDIFSVQRVMHS